uniref:Uncharacterized protein n=1 Tax=Tetranychus urticae TaxID=32264 RepID=T1KX25_TETUR
MQAAPRELKPVVTHHCDFLVYRDDGDSNSDDIGTATLLKVRKTAVLDLNANIDCGIRVWLMQLNITEIICHYLGR